MKKSTALTILSIFAVSTISAQAPAWLKTRPVSDKYFYGRGEGRSADAAELAAMKEIQLQLKAQVNAAIQIASHSGGGEWEVYKKMDTLFSTPRLRNAAVEDRHRSDGTHHALVRYPEDCGLQLARLAVKRYENEHNVNPQTIMNQWDDGQMIRAARMQMFLRDLTSDDYGYDISVSLTENALLVRVMNYPGFVTRLNASQRAGLVKMGRGIGDELANLRYDTIRVDGYASPTGAANEGDALLRISRERAQTVAGILRNVGLPIDTVRGLGAAKLLGNPQTPEGRALNRRVEITVELLP